MRARLSQALGLVVVFLGLYVVAIALAARAPVGEYTLLQTLAGNLVQPGGRYQSLRRFREAETHGKVDIVFFGSSHAYRGFDPRIFAEAGYSSMNLGSMNQTPLNSLALAERYVPRLAPSLVVIELFYPTIAGDGLESCRDLTANTAWSWTTLQMSLETWNLGAITFAVSKGLGLAADESRAVQSDIAGETYIEGGYCETTAHRASLGRPTDEKVPIVVNREQLFYLARLTSRMKSEGRSVIWVTHPLPADYLALLPDHEAVRAVLAKEASAAGVPYWTFDDLALDPIGDYADLHHLSASGVAKFDKALIAKLPRN